ncbi:peptide deformylase, partial [Listeria monocytogenes]|uniref:peptide deformylase n=1 Tax=Listeria monocytogenes TaxID=1639 RepID=UPI000BE0CCF5
VQSYDINRNAVELTAYDENAHMSLHMIDHLNGIQFTKRAHHILNETEVEAYFDNE